MMGRHGFGTRLALSWMRDKAIILKRQPGARNVYGVRRASGYVGNEPVPCYLEVAAGLSETAVLQGRLFLPPSYINEDGVTKPVEVEELDHILLVERFGEALAEPLEFELMGPAQRQATVITLALKVITEGQP